MKYEFLQLKQELKEELTHNILPFWMVKMSDTEHGGFYGQMTGKDQLVLNAPRGGILNARILWSFSAAALYFKNPVYIEYARQAKSYIYDHFFDSDQGGVYEKLNADGTPADPGKQIITQAYFIYGLVEFYRATGDKESLNKAIELFRLIEEHSYDPHGKGYHQVFTKDWIPGENLKPGDNDVLEKNTMNTHLHIMEAYTGLFRVWDNALLEKQLRNLINLFMDKIINKQTHHLDLFFDEKWECKSTILSYGLDIEVAWLLDEAAQVLGDLDLIRKVQAVTLKMVAAASEGWQSNGSVWNEKNLDTGDVDTNCVWWVQAEAMIGFYNAYEQTREVELAHKTLALWEFIKKNLVDKKLGEWHWSVSENGKVDEVNDKAGEWKCPYHNSRMCLELMKRIHE